MNKLTDPQKKMYFLFLNGWEYIVIKGGGVMIKDGFEKKFKRNKTMLSLLHMKLIKPSDNNKYIFNDEKC
jgi:hypothetical protein